MKKLKDVSNHLNKFDSSTYSNQDKILINISITWTVVINVIFIVPFEKHFYTDLSTRSANH